MGKMSDTDRIDFLFKHLFGRGSTSHSLLPAEEVSAESRKYVNPTDICTYWDYVPTHAYTDPGALNMALTKNIIEKRSVTFYRLDGTNSFATDMIPYEKIIPATHGDGYFAPVVKDYMGNVIPIEEPHCFFDYTTGILTFDTLPATVSSENPPVADIWFYIGGSAMSLREVMKLDMCYLQILNAFGFDTVTMYNPETAAYQPTRSVDCTALGYIQIDALTIVGTDLLAIFDYCTVDSNNNAQEGEIRVLFNPADKSISLSHNYKEGTTPVFTLASVALNNNNHAYIKLTSVSSAFTLYYTVRRISKRTYS
jgi:hypothetical protein